MVGINMILPEMVFHFDINVPSNAKVSGRESETHQAVINSTVPILLTEIGGYSMQTG